MKDALITLTVLATLTSTAAAGPKGAKVDPKLPKEVQPMHGMVGTWTAKNVAVTLGGQKTKGDMTLNCTAASGGFAVLCISKINVEGMGTIEETDLFGYDPQAKLYHWYAVTSMGETHDHVALPPTGPTVTFAYSGFQDGKPMQEVIGLTFNDDCTKIDFKNTGVLGGQPAWSIVATMVKK